MLNRQLLEVLKKFFDGSDFNRLPEKYGGGKIFSSPIIGVAQGNDSIFQKFKEVVGEEHLTPLEMWRASGQVDIPESELRVISIIFPYVKKIREESKNVIKLSRIILPAEIYCIGRNYANEFKSETLKKSIQFIKEQGFKGVAGMLSKSFSILTKGRFYSSWSERHIAFAAGLGTFSLHEALISEVGCNIRLASFITDAPFQITPRKSDEPYANCLYYAKGICKSCVEKCPCGAISENGHDKKECYYYGRKVAGKVILRLEPLLKPHYRRINWEWKEQKPPVGCAFCQFDVPCMDKNPMATTQINSN